MRGVLRAAVVISAFRISIKRHQPSLRAGLRWVFISPTQKDSSEKRDNLNYSWNKRLVLAAF